MAHPQHTPALASLEEAITVLLCLVDDAYRHLNPRVRRYESLKGVFGLDGTLDKTLAGLVTRIATKVCAYTYGLYVNRLLSAGRRDASRSFGLEILATLI